VAVEKLAHSEFEKIGSRQEALQTIFSSLLDIFYHPIFDFFQKKPSFQQLQALSQATGLLVIRRFINSYAPSAMRSS
jgi:hypothetical protein